MINDEYDRRSIKPYGIRSKYTSYLTIFNKLGLLVLGILLLYGMIGLPSLLSLLSSERTLAHQVNNEIDSMNVEDVKKMAKSLALQVERAIFYYKSGAILVFGVSLILTPIALINLRCARKLREFLLFAGEDEQQEEKENVEETESS